MYYEEQMINGRWYFRTTPTARWTPMDIFMLSKKYDEALKTSANTSTNSNINKAPFITDGDIQEVREIILDFGSSKNYQNNKIREWFDKHFL